MGQLYALDFPNGKRYIGITTKTAEVRLKGHEQALRTAKTNGPVLYRAWRKHGAPALTVLAIVEDEDLYDTEKRAIAVFGTLSPGGYNLTEGGESSPMKHPEVAAKAAAAKRGVKRSAETRARMSTAKRNPSAETRAKISAAGLGRKASAEACANMSAARRGKKRSPEAVAKTAAANRGRRTSPEAIAKMAATKRGRKHSAEHRAKISAANRGRKHSAEARARMSAAKRNPSTETRARISAAAKNRRAKLPPGYITATVRESDLV